MSTPTTTKTPDLIEAWLDGTPVAVPPDQRSLVGIRCLLETLAMEKQRVLSHVVVDGQPIELSGLDRTRTPFSRVEAESIEMDQMPLQVVRLALHQVMLARDEVFAAIPLVLINEGRVAREFWWGLARKLKEPLLTLSVLPDDACGPSNGRASLTQLRKWQLQQVAAIIRRVDEACRCEDSRMLAETLENRVLGWLETLQTTLELWFQTLQAAHGIYCHAD